MVEPTHVLVGYPIDFCYGNHQPNISNSSSSSCQYHNPCYYPEPSFFLKSLGCSNDAIAYSFMAIMTDPAIHFFNHRHNTTESSSYQMMREMEACAAGIMHYAFDYHHEAETCVHQYLEQQALLAAPLSTHIITRIVKGRVHQKQCGEVTLGNNSSSKAVADATSHGYEAAQPTTTAAIVGQSDLYYDENADSDLILPSSSSLMNEDEDAADHSWFDPPVVEEYKATSSGNATAFANDMQNSIADGSQWNILDDDPGPKTGANSIPYADDELNSEYGYYDGVLEWLLSHVQHENYQNIGRDAWSRVYGLTQQQEKTSPKQQPTAINNDMPNFDQDFPALTPTKKITPSISTPTFSTTTAALDFATIVRRHAPRHASSNNSTIESSTQQHQQPNPSAAFNKIRSWLSSSDRLVKQLNRPARIPWLETGDPVTQLYRTERRHAHQCWAQMRCYYQIAQKCYRRQDWANARWYAQEARYYRTRMKELHHQASRRIFAQRNQEDALFIDLHGMHVDEARASTVQWFHSMLRDGYRGIVYVVTGIGHHSRPLNHRQQQQLNKNNNNTNGKLRPAIAMFLKSIYRCEETSVYGDDKGGVFAVYLCSHRFIPSSLLPDRRVCLYCKFEQEL